MSSSTPSAASTALTISCGIGDRRARCSRGRGGVGSGPAGAAETAVGGFRGGGLSSPCDSVAGGRSALKSSVEKSSKRIEHSHRVGLWYDGSGDERTQ